MNNKTPLFECQGTVGVGHSRFEYALDCLFGILGRIRIFDDRIVLYRCWKNHEFFVRDIKSIQVATFLGHKVGIIIHLASDRRSPYIRFDSLSENKVEALIKVLILGGYPVETDVIK